MREINNFIKNKKINLKKLEEFGFELINNSCYYHTFLLKNQFKMSVEQIWCYFDKLASMELYSIYCYSDEKSEKETKVKISSISIFS